MFQRIHVTVTHGGHGQGALCFNQVGTQADGFAQFLDRTLRISRFVESQAEMVVGYAIIGIVLEHILQSLDRVSGLPFAS